MRKMIYALVLLFTMSVQVFADTSAIRVGMLKSGDIDVTVEDVDDEYPKFEDTYTDGEDGWEISYVGGLDTTEGFDFRPVFTFQSVEIDSASTMTILGEFEFAYNINKYISPFIGFNGGLGYVDFDSDVNIDNTVRYQFGLFIGVCGEIYKGFGYYAKYESSANGMYNNFDTGTDDIDVITTQTSTPMRFGVSYTF